VGAGGANTAGVSPVPGTSGVMHGGSTQITRVAPALPTQPLPQPAVSNILPRHPVPLASRPPVPAAGGQPPTSASPGPAAAPRPSGPPGSQQVQLRVSNDEPHRAFCLSWLKATYEPSGGKSIEQNIMYKQYLASMHRMGRKEVISAQHYALCIRTLFGGSTGPNKKQVGDKLENHYTGIQVREHPLPLKLTPAQAAAAQEASRQQQAAAPAPTQNGAAASVQPQPVQVQQVVQTGAGQQRIVSTNQGQQIIVNAQGQQILTGGQIIQGGVQKVMVNAQGQQVLVNTSQAGGQVIQVNPGSNIVTSGGQLIVNQAGQVVQQRIVSGQGAIVAQGLVQGQVISSGFQNRNTVTLASGTATTGGQQIPLGQVIQRIVHPGGRVEEKVVGTTGGQTAGGQIVLHGPGGQQHVVQAQPQQGQVILQQQPQQQQQPVTIQPQPQQPQQQQPVVIQSGQTVVTSGVPASNTPVQVITSTTGGQGANGGQPQVIKTQVKSGDTEILENGMSPLDGILPQDSKFGVLEGDMVNELLEKSENNIVMNGAANHLEGVKMNGDVGNKRLLGEFVDNSPAKRQALEGNTGVVVTNGGHGNGSLNGGGIRLPLASSGGGQLVQNAQGQIFLKTQSASGGVVLQPAGQAGQAGGQLIYQGSGETGQPGQNKIVLLQQHQQNQAGQPQQTVVRVSAPVAQVAAPGAGDHLPQVDGAEETEEEEGDKETVENGESVPQVDGTTVEPVTSTQQPEPQQQQQQQSAASPGPSPAPSQSTVIQPRPVTISAVQPQSSASASLSQTEPAPSPSPPPQQQASGATTVKIDTQKPFLCEWQGCMKSFKTPKEVENHAIGSHCPLGSDDIPCLWSRCDGMKRKRFSLMTHLQDRHCHPQLMKLMAVRRVQIAQTGKSDVPLPPAPPPHPGYAPNAALHAIKRHAVEFASPKENAMRDEKEGPVTKSIRLTASLILKNLVIYSSIGRSRLRAYESHMSTVALSNVESARTVSQILYEMANASDF